MDEKSPGIIYIGEMLNDISIAYALVDGPLELPTCLGNVCSSFNELRPIASIRSRHARLAPRIQQRQITPHLRDGLLAKPIMGAFLP